ncbi:TIGR03943 family putative permease subunit [Peribacillus alkalitolerans]|uniref:TIGR03943 family putative permease subunit n=1 Tax=Peribacillus alkalitolerans TaxID=1550385 RepID=UPI0013D4FF59|nr:TIGR03943 family protein [Peribacillus alkalitolerans]
MRFSFQQAFRAFIILGFSGFIMSLHWTGEINKYINPKYEALSKIAALIFFLLFIVQLTRVWNRKEQHHHEHACDHGDACHHDHGQTPFTFKKLVSYVIIILPLLTGIILPAKTLNASMAESKGGALLARDFQKSPKSVGEIPEVDLPEEDSTEVEQDDPVLQGEHGPDLSFNEKEMSEDKFEKLQADLQKQSFIDMKDDLFSTYYELISQDIKPFEGKKIKLTGFVYKEEGFGSNQLVLSRFLVTHCVADASVIGFLTEFDDASGLKPDTWVEAEGVIKLGRYGEMDLPIIQVTNWKTTSEPKQPYVYPIVVKLI